MWLLRAAWASLPLTLGESLDRWVGQQPESSHTILTLVLWGIWIIVVTATLVLHPASLTMVRLLAPAALVIAVILGAAGHGGLGVLPAAIAFVTAFAASTGISFVNGLSYPNERRHPLRVPGLFAMAAVPAAAVALVPPGISLIFLARKGGAVWVLALVSCCALSVLIGRGLHVLSRRWLVFVPNGLVLHDPVTLVDPVLFLKGNIESLSPAPVGTNALDLTAGAVGLALELSLYEKVPMVRWTGKRRSPVAGSSALVMFTPTRAAAVLEEFRRRQGRTAKQT